MKVQFGNGDVGRNATPAEGATQFSQQSVEELAASEFRIGQSSTRLVSETRNAEVGKRVSAYTERRRMCSEQ